MQSYKLFYNETVLSIVRYEHYVQTDTISKNCFMYESISDLTKIISLFLHKNQSITIVCKNPEEEKTLWQDIKKYFLLERAAGGIVFKENSEKLEIANNRPQPLKGSTDCPQFQKSPSGDLGAKNKLMVLSIYRLKRWDFPKGHVEIGETDNQTAIREVMEETGIDELSICKDLGYTYYVFPRHNQFILKETHWYQMQTTSNKILVAQAEEGIEKAAWIPVNEINLILNNMYPSLVDLWQRNNLDSEK
jgi:8-oxo-dGTP pyrophosphatase MutT (NUDIX family)